ncbi:MAG: hypothetical protein LUF68_01740 [Clostridiales bacterium]|nr:hypothetical protein [Clostridiales bacterium]
MDYSLVTFGLICAAGGAAFAETLRITVGYIAWRRRHKKRRQRKAAERNEREEGIGVS